MGKCVDLIGERQGRLTCVEYLGLRKRKDGHNDKIWKCVCDCGKEVVLTSQRFLDGKTKSCGCYRRERISELKRKGLNPRLYRVFGKMKERCYDDRCEFYRNYGGRGIKICKEWVDDYYTFQKWAYENRYRQGLTIERIDNNGDYEPSNCAWVTMKVQSNNKRNNRRITHNGVTKTLAEWCDEYNVGYSRTRYRLEHGYSFEQAFTNKLYKNAKEGTKNGRAKNG